MSEIIVSLDRHVAEQLVKRIKHPFHVNVGSEAVFQNLLGALESALQSGDGSSNSGVVSRLGCTKPGARKTTRTPSECRRTTGIGARSRRNSDDRCTRSRPGSASSRLARREEKSEKMKPLTMLRRAIPSRRFWV